MSKPKKSKARRMLVIHERMEELEIGTQADLACKAGLGETTVSRLFSGGRGTPGTRTAVAKALGLTVKAVDKAVAP